VGIVAAIAGQLIAAIVLDHFGILRDDPIHVNLPRLLAAALVLIAVPLSRVS
jgi:uncharacterized membrane protein YdcZ (DUF606 family)